MKSPLRFWLAGLAFLPAAAWAQAPLPDSPTDAPPARSQEMRRIEATFQQQLTAAVERAAAACTNTTTLDFSTALGSGDWKNHAPVNAGAASTNTTIRTAGSYVEPVGGTQTTLATGTYDTYTSLRWDADYTSPQNATTQITFSFNRPVNNFTLVVNDIDERTDAWIDKITFNGTQANGTILNLSSADATVTRDAAFISLSGNSLTGLQDVASTSRQATATVTFNKPITSLQITYQNTLNIADPIGQFIAIDKMTWCTQANVATTLSGPARAITGTQVTYTATTTASGDYDATGVRPTVQLSPGLNTQSPQFPANSSYDNATGLLTLPTIPLLAVGTSSVSTIKFNMPASTVTGQAKSTIDTDDSDPLDNNGTLAAANVTTTTNQAPTAQAKSATVSANTTSYFPLPDMTGTDPDNDPLTYIIDGSSIGNVGFGTVYYTRNGVRTALSGTSNVSLTAAEATTLEFRANNTAAINNSATLRYLVTDAFGGTSAQVAYSIRVADQPAVYSSPNVYYNTQASTSNRILATVTDPDGTITGATRITGTLPANLNLATVTGTVGSGANAISVKAGEFYGTRNASIPAGTYNFTVTTTGPGGTSTAIPVTIRILTGDTDASYSTGNTYNRDALTAGATLATVTDPDGGIADASMTTTPAVGITLDGTTGNFVVGSTVPFAGTYTYTVNTTDAAGGTTAAPVTITINDDVEAVYSAVKSLNRDALTNGTSLETATDADGTIVSATLAGGSLPAGTALNATTGAFTISNAATAAALANGTYSFNVLTVDATGGRSTSLVSVNLFETESVYASVPAKTGPYANGFSLATVSDADGNINSAALNTGAVLPPGVGLNASTGEFTVTNRTLLRTGTYSVSTRTTDVTGGVTIQTVTINIGASPLPVELTSFSAQTAGNDAKLTWTTAQELNNDQFVVERSVVAGDFVAIGTVKGNGSSTQAHSYSFTDAGIGAKKAGTVYYRLRQVDTDGKTSTTTVRALSFAASLSAKLAVYPNPAMATATLDLSALAEGSYQVMLVDLQGRTLRSGTYAGGAAYPLALQDLPKGTYVVLVRGVSGKLTQTLVKE
jgi:hypothetical protein